MKNRFLALLILFGVCCASAATAQPRPRIKAKRAFSHGAEASRGKNSKAQFYRANRGTSVLDLKPHSLEKFKTAKAGKDYKYSDGNGFKSKKLF